MGIVDEAKQLKRQINDAEKRKSQEIKVAEARVKASRDALDKAVDEVQARIDEVTEEFEKPINRFKELILHQDRIEFEGESYSLENVETEVSSGVGKVFLSVKTQEKQFTVTGNAEAEEALRKIGDQISNQARRASEAKEQHRADIAALGRAGRGQGKLPVGC